jgi:solute carrier family 10 (sodium/bile acid cotransporter), member 7
MKATLNRIRPDNFTMLIVTMVLLATVLPAQGRAADYIGDLAIFAIGLLFFLQGARLSGEAVVAGLTHWRLHLLILACSFVLFPLLGFGLHAIAPGLLTQPLWLGVLFLCVLPSTVQSSIAFTSIGRGNIAAAVCAATASNLLGMVITPVLVSVLLSTHAGGISWDEVTKIVLQLLLPFGVGHALRPWIGPWAARNRTLLSYTDRSSILLVVYTAFSGAVVEGIWRTVPLIDLGILVLVDGVLLALVLLITTWGSRLLGFDKEDEVTIVFCGSKKTLASGIPMANVLFAGPAVGMVVLPLMIFHQMQLMVGAALARRYAARFDRAAPEVAFPIAGTVKK